MNKMLLVPSRSLSVAQLLRYCFPLNGICRVFHIFVSLPQALLISIQLLALQIKLTSALCLGTVTNSLCYIKIPTYFGP
jgi:hypothetical protein